MPDSITFTEFAALSPYTDPVDVKKLRFIYRAIEDFATERRISASDIKVLEVGCGVGGITLPLARLGARVRALDINEADVARLMTAARERLFYNLDATVEDAFNFRDTARYDVVVASQVLEYVLEPERLIGNLVCHMEPGGLLIVTAGNIYGPWCLWRSLSSRPRRWNWLRRAFGKPPYVARVGQVYCQYYTRKRLMRMFDQQGLQLHRFMNSDFVLGVFSKHFRRSRVLGAFDTSLADIIPYWMASGWYFALRLNR